MEHMVGGVLALEYFNAQKMAKLFIGLLAQILNNYNRIAY